MTTLTADQIDHYRNKGYISSVNALSSNEAKEIRNEIEKIEKNWPGALEGINRNYVHLISPILNKVCLNKNILDAVESIIGKNILICGTTLFIKEKNEKGFVSFHQDAKYIGLEPHNWVTVWLAVTDSNEKNGCMRMLPGSHKENLKFHEEKFDKNNLLTRGQTIKDISLDKTDPIVLKAGEISLHHPLIVHGSGLNNSDDRRIGFVVQSYIGTDVDQVIGKMYVQKARGEDKYNYHEYSEIPLKLMGKNEIISQNKANKELSKIFYNGSNRKGKF
jgi:chlorinating enzyme